jgi:hypothetical protein
MSSPAINVSLRFDQIPVPNATNKAAQYTVAYNRDNNALALYSKRKAATSDDQLPSGTKKAKTMEERMAEREQQQKKKGNRKPESSPNPIPLPVSSIKLYLSNF